LFLDVAAYLYVAFEVHSHPAFGAVSLVIADYAFFAISTVFFFTILFSAVCFRYYRNEYRAKLKDSSRFLSMFLRLALIRRVKAGY